jgi:hypothetical protein
MSKGSQKFASVWPKKLVVVCGFLRSLTANVKKWSLTKRFNSEVLSICTKVQFKELHCVVSFLKPRLVKSKRQPTHVNAYFMERTYSMLNGPSAGIQLVYHWCHWNNFDTCTIQLLTSSKHGGAATVNVSYEMLVYRDYPFIKIQGSRVHLVDALG